MMCGFIRRWKVFSFSSNVANIATFISSNYRVPVLLSNEISSHVIEKILHVVSPELWQEIYNSYFNTHVPQLAQHPIANFIVQHLMASVADKSQVGLLIE